MQKDVIQTKDNFQSATERFFKKKPVKVAKPLKDEFANYINRYAMVYDIENYSYVITPLVHSYKFQRTKFRP